MLLYVKIGQEAWIGYTTSLLGNQGKGGERDPIRVIADTSVYI